MFLQPWDASPSVLPDRHNGVQRLASYLMCAGYLGPSQWYFESIASPLERLQASPTTWHAICIYMLHLAECRVLVGH